MCLFSRQGGAASSGLQPKELLGADPEKALWALSCRWCPGWWGVNWALGQQRLA